MPIDLPPRGRLIQQADFPRERPAQIFGCPFSFESDASTLHPPFRIDLNEGIPPLTHSAGLETFTEPLTERTARHILRRLNFGAPVDVIASLVGQPADEVIDALIDAALSLPLPEAPAWANASLPGPNATQEEWDAYNEANDLRKLEYRLEWLQLMYQHGLRERLALFWHNHFVTNAETYFHAPIAYRYVTLLRQHALGNFKQFVYDIGLDGAMLIYLDGHLNEVGAPNENYARELLELFTTGIHNNNGQPNYTEQDIQEMARALTGWVVRADTWESMFLPHRHDTGFKEFLGHRGTFGYDDVIDIIFESRAQEIASFICEKLYREFVYVTPSPDLIDALAQVFIDHDFEIAPVLRTLLKSAHFFDEAILGARIKSPTELMLGYLIEMEGPPTQGRRIITLYSSFLLDQYILNPPNVNGWQQHRNWVTTKTLPDRFDTVGWMTWGAEEYAEALPFVSLAEKLHDPADPHAAFRLPTRLVEHLFSISPESLDLEEISGNFSGDLVNNPIPSFVLNGPPHVSNLAKLFLFGVPWYEWNLYNPDMSWMPLLFLQNISQLPEFQLT